MIHFIQPFGYGGLHNAGKAYNEAIEPLKGWICITDHDTLKFDGFADRVKQIVDNSLENYLITCSTNRLRSDNKNLVKGMYDIMDIDEHYKCFNNQWELYGATLERTREAIPGMCMIFHRSLFDRVRFREGEPNFDNHFTTDARKAGFVTYVAKGLYLFHVYNRFYQ